MTHGYDRPNNLHAILKVLDDMKFKDAFVCINITILEYQTKYHVPCQNKKMNKWN